MDKTLIIIPAFNEENNIASTINSVKDSIPKAVVVVVNDGSKDDTGKIAQESNAVVISHAINLGDGAARQTGFKYALKKGYDYAIHLDADGQHSAKNIIEIWNELKSGEYDIVIGSRFLTNMKSDINFLRRIGIKIFSCLASTLTGRLITDPTSGFRGVNREAMKFYVNQFYPECYPDADVIIASHYANLKIKEIPVSMNKRIQGKSLHSGLSPIYYVYKMCLSIFSALFYRYGGKDVN